MKKLKILLILVILLTGCFKQNPELQNIPEEGEIIRLYDCANDEWYNGKVDLANEGIADFGLNTSKVKVKNGYLDGTVKTYDYTGTLLKQITYNYGKIDGKYLKFYSNGQLKIKAFFDKNLLNGKYEEYYSNGQLKIKAIYKNNLLNGKYEEYMENGNLKFKTEYKKGVKEN